MAYTKEIREQIVREFASRHGGVYDPAAFLTEVKEQGRRHPAYQWFEWSDKRASYEYRLWQARQFANKIRISYSVEVIDRGTMRIIERTGPLVISPIAGRENGGGYHIADYSKGPDLLELQRQAWQALQMLIERHEIALASAGVLDRLNKIADQLEPAAEELEDA